MRVAFPIDDPEDDAVRYLLSVREEAKRTVIPEGVRSKVVEADCDLLLTDADIEQHKEKEVASMTPSRPTVVQRFREMRRDLPKKHSTHLPLTRESIKEQCSKKSPNPSLFSVQDATMSVRTLECCTEILRQWRNGELNGTKEEVNLIIEWCTTALLYLDDLQSLRPEVGYTLQEVRRCVESVSIRLPEEDRDASEIVVEIIKWYFNQR